MVESILRERLYFSGAESLWAEAVEEHHLGVGVVNHYVMTLEAVVVASLEAS